MPLHDDLDRHFMQQALALARDASLIGEVPIAAMLVRDGLVIAKGHNILILSDRGMDAENAAIPALLAVSCLHHHLIREETRTKVSLLLESGEPIEWTWYSVAR